MLRKLRDDWRRGRATKVIELDRDYVLSFPTETVGRVDVRLVFLDEGDTLHARIAQFYAHDYMERTGAHRAPIGAKELYKFLELVCGPAAVLGYKRLRVSGERMLKDGKRRRQDFSVPVARFQVPPRSG